MEVTMNIPDDIAEQLEPEGGDVSRRLLELASIRAYEAEEITGRQVMEMLGFESREELWEFFKKNDVRDGYTLEDLETDRVTLTALLNKR